MDSKILTNENTNVDIYLQIPANFNSLNFNLKKIIFSFLSLKDKGKIYWSNKKLRKLLECDFSVFHIKKFALVHNMPFKGWFKLNNFVDGSILCVERKYGKKRALIIKNIFEYDIEKLKVKLESEDHIVHGHNIYYPSNNFLGVYSYISKSSRLVKFYDTITSISKISETQFAMAYSKKKIIICNFDPIDYVLEIKITGFIEGYSKLFCFNESLLMYNGSNSLVIYNLKNNNKKQIVKTENPGMFLRLDEEHFACSNNGRGTVSIYSVYNNERIKLKHKIKDIKKSMYSIQIDLLFKEYMVIIDPEERMKLYIWDWKNRICIHIIKSTPTKDFLVTENNLILCKNENHFQLFQIKL